MDKELEALETVYNNIDYLTSDIVIEDNEVNDCLITIKEQLLTIKQALLELKTIKEANPSEALECLEEIIHEFNEPHYELSGEYSYKNELLRRCENEVNTIKQALLKAQENENTEVIGGRTFGKDILNLKECVEKYDDKPILYISRTYGNKYIVPQKQFDDLTNENVEYKKALKIIFEKKVNILLLYVVDSVDTYNQMYVYYKRNIINVKWCLTQEEFDLLKRWQNE